MTIGCWRMFVFHLPKGANLRTVWEDEPQPSVTNRRARMTTAKTDTHAASTDIDGPRDVLVIVPDHLQDATVK